MSMWARFVEIITGVWLLSSPVIFGHEPRAAGIAGGTAVILLAALSFLEPLRRAHLLSMLVGVWVAGRGFLSADPASAAAQNEMLAGLLILMLAIVPSSSNLPPPSWQQAENPIKTIKE